MLFSYTFLFFCSTTDFIKEQGEQIIKDSVAIYCRAVSLFLVKRAREKKIKSCECNDSGHYLVCSCKAVNFYFRTGSSIEKIWECMAFLCFPVHVCHITSRGNKNIPLIIRIWSRHPPSTIFILTNNACWGHYGNHFTWELNSLNELFS